MKKYGYNVEKVFDNVYRISDAPSMNSYLILGNKKGMLIDTGCGVGNLRKLIDELCPMDYYVVNTHGHCDHVAANYQFDDIYISKEDADMMLELFENNNEKELHYKMMHDYNVSFSSEEFKKEFQNSTVNFRIKYIEDGQIFNLGGITIEAIKVPGHTPGGLSFIEIENKRLYNGDIVLRHASILHKNGTDIKTFINGLNKLWANEKKYDITIASHGHRKDGFKPLHKEMVLKLIDCAKEINILESVNKVEFDGTGLEYKMANEDISIAYKINQLNV